MKTVIKADDGNDDHDEEDDAKLQLARHQNPPPRTLNKPPPKETSCRLLLEARSTERILAPLSEPSPTCSPTSPE